MPTCLTIGIDDLKSFHRKLTLIAVALLIMHAGAMMMKYAMGKDMTFGLVPLFDFYEERNVPTYFSSLNLLLTAAILFYIASVKRVEGDRHQRAWFVLSCGFVFMSIDEMADLRIVLSNFVKGVLKNDQYVQSIPFFSVAWTVPVFVIVVMLAVYFIPFLFSLKQKYLVHFGLSGALFVFATIGLETLGGNQSIATHGVRDLTFMFLVTIEESIEMASILYFQLYLIKYLQEYYPSPAMAAVPSAR